MHNHPGNQERQLANALLRFTRTTKTALCQAVVFLVVPIVAYALVAGGAPAAPSSLCEVLDSIFQVVKVFGSVVLVVAVVMLLWAGILFMTGGGNEEKIKQARQILIFALVGLAVAILALQADNIVDFAISGDFLDQCSVLDVEPTGDLEE